MIASADFAVWLIVLGAVSYACRAGGFWLMRHVPRAERFEQALSAAPLAVMIGIVAPALARGGAAELAGVGVVALTTVLVRNELVAALAGVATVALARAAGFA